MTNFPKIFTSSMKKNDSIDENIILANWPLTQKIR